MPDELRDYFIAWLPYLMLLFVPVFAMLVRMFFRRREHPYSDYLVFSLHFNSFVFMVLSLIIATFKIFPKFDLLPGFFILIPVVYLGIAVHRVFRPRVVPMMLKIVALGIVYFIFMIVALVCFVIVLAVMIKKIDIFA